MSVKSTKGKKNAKSAKSAKPAKAAKAVKAKAIKPTTATAVDKVLGEPTEATVESPTEVPIEAPTESPAESAATSKTVLAKYHDVSAFCGTHDNLAVDYVKFDASLSQLHATDGHLAITVPVDDCEIPVDALLDRDKLTGAVIGKAGMEFDADRKLLVLNGEAVEWPEKNGKAAHYPNLVKVVNSATDPDFVLCLGVPVLKKLIEYGEVNGADSINFAIAHESGKTWKERKIVAPIRFFMQVDVDETGEKTRDVSGVLMPVEPEDRDVLEYRLNAAIAVTKTKDERVAATNGKSVRTGKAAKSCKSNDKTHGKAASGKGRTGKATRQEKPVTPKAAKPAKPAAKQSAKAGGDGASLADYVNSFIDKSKEWLSQERFGLARSCLNKARSGVVSMNGKASKELIESLNQLDAKITKDHQAAKANGWKPPRKE